MKNELALKNIFFYSLIAIPLSFISLPLYINAPKFYFDLGLSLTHLSIAIISIRILDAFFDPLFGIIFKKFQGKRLLICLIFAPIIGIAFYFLFNPLENYLLVNLILSLAITSMAGSAITINYESFAAEAGNSYEARTKIITIRESMQILGVIFATTLPSFIGYKHFSLISLVIIILFALLAFLYSKEPQGIASITTEKKKNILSELFLCIQNLKFRSLIIPHILNSIASSIPAILFLFFVTQSLKAKEIEAGYFLMTYFVSAFISMPFWFYLSKKFNKKTSWQISILLAISTFSWAFFLNEQNYQLFYVICFLSGFATGGDLSMPTAILSDIAHKTTNKSSEYYGIWGFLAKLNFALATLIAFSLLNLLNTLNMFKDNVSFIYALVPVAFKILALIFLTLKFKEDL